MSHNLRTDLQEMLNRLMRSSNEQFANNLKFLLKKIEENHQLKGILNEAASIFPITEIEIEEFANDSYREEMVFESEENRATFSYLFLKYVIKICNNHEIHRSGYFDGGVDQKKEAIIGDFIVPIINLLHEKLDKSNSILYLLEKYKKRVEWFTKQSLIAKYKNTDKNYEQILEDDLRLFLFDQGVDYPFSTPKSTSGRADIVSLLDSDESMIIEIKIFDKQKGYDKKRIFGGFTQIVSYANDYSKPVGFLVVYNFDDIELNFKLSNEGKDWPPSIIFNHKTFYFIVVNCFEGVSASKKGKLTEILITSEELSANFEN